MHTERPRPVYCRRLIIGRIGWGWWRYGGYGLNGVSVVEIRRQVAVEIVMRSAMAIVPVAAGEIIGQGIEQIWQYAEPI